MFDAFPYEEWSEDISGFWTFGPGNSTGTYILTAIAITVMFIVFIGFFVFENRKLAHQESVLKASGALDRPPTGR